MFPVEQCVIFSVNFLSRVIFFSTEFLDANYKCFIRVTFFTNRNNER